MIPLLLRQRGRKELELCVFLWLELDLDWRNEAFFFGIRFILFYKRENILTRIDFNYFSIMTLQNL